MFDANASAGLSGGDILTIAGAIMGAFGAVVAALASYAVNKRDKEVDRRIDEVKTLTERGVADAKKGDDEHRVRLEGEVRALTAAQHKLELEHAHLDGEFKVLAKSNENVERDVKEIKQDMVSRKEWREGQDRLEEQNARLESKLDQWMRVRGFPSTGGMAAAIPREEPDMGGYKGGGKR